MRLRFSFFNASSADSGVTLLFALHCRGSWGRVQANFADILLNMIEGLCTPWLLSPELFRFDSGFKSIL